MSTVTPTSSTPTCPKCGSALRKLYRRSDSHPFYGCSAYPRCKHTANVESIEKPVDAAPHVKVEREWSSYQKAVFDFVVNGSGNAVVTAVAGSGKTSTLEHLISLVPAETRLAFLAFNKSIARELSSRIDTTGNHSVSTLHSLGYSEIRAAFPGCKMEERKFKLAFDDLVSQYEFSQRESLYEWASEIKKIVSLLRATLSPLTEDSVVYLCERYGIMLNGALPLVTDFSIRMVGVLRSNHSLIDFDDMIDFPATGIVPVSNKFDWVLVDEAADLNKAQIALVLKTIAENGRVLAVGDKNQSIYGFRGADTQAIPNLIAALHAITLPLSITYRCPLSHVRLAQTLVPQIEARPGAPEGTLEAISHADLLRSVEAGDLVLCRTNAPLVKPCFELISRGVKATIMGRDVSADLVSLVQRVQKKAHVNTLNDLLYALTEYRDREMFRLTASDKSAQAAALDDQVETVLALSAGVSTLAALVPHIESVFSDDIEGVKFSSIHKAKGLEAKSVYILRPDLMPHPMATSAWEQEQEFNILYVALSRSKDALYLVRSEKCPDLIDPADFFAAKVTQDEMESINA